MTQRPNIPPNLELVNSTTKRFPCFSGHTRVWFETGPHIRAIFSPLFCTLGKLQFGDGAVMLLRWSVELRASLQSRPLVHPFQLLQSQPKTLQLARQQSYFHTTPTSLATPVEPSHYDILGLPYTASAGEIKRKYYELSKAHHPDCNPNDPEASSRFARLSDAYGVIGNPKKRAAYDRDLARKGGIRHARANSGPAGGRPASGLSRRQTQFHGPPPSFFRSGGWTTSGGPKDTASAAAAGSTNFGFGAGGIGTQSGRRDDVPHFNYEAHMLQQERRMKRKTRPSEYELTPGVIMPIIGVITLLFVAVTVSSNEQKGNKVNRKRPLEQSK